MHSVTRFTELQTGMGGFIFPSFLEIINAAYIHCRKIIPVKCHPTENALLIDVFLIGKHQNPFIKVSYKSKLSLNTCIYQNLMREDGWVGGGEMLLFKSRQHHKNKIINSNSICQEHGIIFRL